PGLRAPATVPDTGYHTRWGGESGYRVRAELPARPGQPVPAVLSEGSDQHAQPPRRHPRRTDPRGGPGERRGIRRLRHAAADQPARADAAPLHGPGAPASGAAVPGAAGALRRAVYLR